MRVVVIFIVESCLCRSPGFLYYPKPIVPGCDRAHNPNLIVPGSDRAHDVAGGFISFDMILWRPNGQIAYSARTPVRSSLTNLIVPVSDRAQEVAGGFISFVMILWIPCGQIAYSAKMPVRLELETSKNDFL